MLHLWVSWVVKRAHSFCISSDATCTIGNSPHFWKCGWVGFQKYASSFQISQHAMWVCTFWKSSHLRILMMSFIFSSLVLWNLDVVWSILHWGQLNNDVIIKSTLSHFFVFWIGYIIGCKQCKCPPRIHVYLTLVYRKVCWHVLWASCNWNLRSYMVDRMFVAKVCMFIYLSNFLNLNFTSPVITPSSKKWHHTRWSK